MATFMASVEDYMVCLRHHIRDHGNVVQVFSESLPVESRHKLLLGFTSPIDTIVIDASLLREFYLDSRLSFWDMLLRFTRETDFVRREALRLREANRPREDKELGTCWEFYDEVTKQVRKHGAGQIHEEGPGTMSTPEGGFFVPLQTLLLEHHGVAGGQLYKTIQADVDAFLEAVQKGES